MRSLGALVSVLLAAPYARAVDGVIEINQAKALAGGVTSGDAPGLPVTLSASGSYRLTGNLTRIGDGDAIEITADNVTLDLGGFTVRCVAVPSFPCSSGSGVEAMDRAASAVRNGSVRDFGSHGVRTGSSARIEGLRVSGNNLTGVSVSTESIVTGNTVEGNGTFGIFTAEGSLVTGNSAEGNAASGIRAGSGSTVTGNTARGNTRCGLVLISPAGFGHNVLTGNNGGNGFRQVTGGIQTGINVCGNTTDCAAGTAASCP